MKKLMSSLAILFMAFLAVAQENVAVTNAFKESYAFETAGEYKKGVDALKAVYQEESFEINLRLGWLNYMAGLFTESLAYYQKAIAIAPYAIQAKLGYVYPASALGNWDQVEKQYKEILVVDPANTLVNYRLGLIYYGREQYETAFKYFEKVVNLYPFDYDGLIMLAWTSFKLGKTREAKVMFNKCLMISPGDESATEGLSLIK